MNRYMMPYLEVTYENENDEIKRLKEEWLANRNEYLFYLKCYRVMFSNGHDYGEQWIEVLTNIKKCHELEDSLEVKLRLNGAFY